MCFAWNRLQLRDSENRHHKEFFRAENFGFAAFLTFVIACVGLALALLVAASDAKSSAVRALRRFHYRVELKFKFHGTFSFCIVTLSVVGKMAQADNKSQTKIMLMPSRLIRMLACVIFD
jgi:hypothetical protein